jgi:hypothetical protein
MNANFLYTSLANLNITNLLLCFKLASPLKLSLIDPRCLQVAESRFQPQLILYNAGTDILDGDPLGSLKVCFSCKIHIFSQHSCKCTYLQWRIGCSSSKAAYRCMNGSILLI